jgi:hypothetical protein
MVYGELLNLSSEHIPNLEKNLVSYKEVWKLHVQNEDKQNIEECTRIQTTDG